MNQPPRAELAARQDPRAPRPRPEGPSRGPAPGRKGPPPLRGDQERGAQPRHTAQELGANRSPNSWLFRHETL